MGCWLVFWKRSYREYKGGLPGVATIRTAPCKFLTKIMMFQGMSIGVYRRESRSPGKGASNRQGITARLGRGNMEVLGLHEDSGEEMRRRIIATSIYLIKTLVCSPL